LKEAAKPTLKDLLLAGRARGDSFPSVAAVAAALLPSRPRPRRLPRASRASAHKRFAASAGPRNSASRGPFEFGLLR
jgi:hypothetical protein